MGLARETSSAPKAKNCVHPSIDNRGGSTIHNITRGTLCAGDSSLSSQLDLAHAQVCHICTRYCATVINGAVHSKYTEEKSADSFCEPDSEKNSVSEGSSFRLL